MEEVKLPRIMLAGTSGDCGKTLVALGLTAAWRRQGIPVAPFKKGPDYIDPAWLSLAADTPAHNLDTWMMESQVVLRSFFQNATRDGINLVEANRGLHDGEDSAGSHSSAELSKLLKIPVVLIIPAVKVTRTVAAFVLGLQMMDRDVEIAGIILNKVATARQETVIRASVENCTGLQVFGAIRRISGELLSSRHLGLVTPEEHIQSRRVISSAADIISESVDLPRIRSIADNSAPFKPQKPVFGSRLQPESGLKIGYFRSPAFTFYYPENLEAIGRYGAVKVPVDPINETALPDLDALYIGGGFPETHAASLSANVSFRDSVALAAQSGLPIWAECGGLIFLCRALHWQGHRYPMAGVFPAEVALDRAPAGHGYEEVVVDRSNPFLATGTVLRGHEFHYSRLYPSGLPGMDTIFQVKRGTGLGFERDGLICGNAVASYLHLHALGSTQWMAGLLHAAADFAKSRGQTRSILD
jgi:cobyrinic acid a,c-diamide synthase